MREGSLEMAARAHSLHSKSMCRALRLVPPLSAQRPHSYAVNELGKQAKTMPFSLFGRWRRSNSAFLNARPDEDIKEGKYTPVFAKRAQAGNDMGVATS